MTGYRYQNEQLILFLTFIVILIIGVIATGVTLCLAPLFIVVAVMIAYQSNQRHHRGLMQRAMPVSRERTPDLYRLAAECVDTLEPGKVSLYVVPNRTLNAYTFGISDPKGIVLYSQLFKVMDKDELKFIIGHEMGHVSLGHAWLNTLLGGMAGVPMGFGGMIVLTLAFRWWNRACEYSADRAGMLACGNPNKAITALVKLSAQGDLSPRELQQQLSLIEKEDDSVLRQLANTFQTHPMTIDRIEKIQEWVRSGQYERWQKRVDR